MKKASETYNLVYLKKSYCEQWHPILNGDKQPKNYTPHSDQKIFWLCLKGKLSEHVWSASIKVRERGCGCPFCANQKVCLDNCIATRRPDMESKWHSTRNNATPYDYMPNSSYVATWFCPNGKLCEHIYRMRTADVGNGAGCPYCSGQRVCLDNCLATLRPDLIGSFHAKLNIDENGKILTPYDFTVCSGKMVTWICHKGILSEHIWTATIANRVNGNTGCPFCDGKQVCLDNCLATICPENAQEWDYNDNGEKTPLNTSSGSSYKAAWICSVCGHKWKATCSNRKNGNGCPHCFRQTSKYELLIHSQMKYILPTTQLKFKLNGYEIDSFDEESKIGIEIDGYWHTGKEKRDQQKSKNLIENGIKLLRVRDVKVGKLHPDDIVMQMRHGKFSINSLKEIVHKIEAMLKTDNQISNKIKNRIDEILNTNDIKTLPNLEYYNELYMQMNKREPTNSLAITHPNIAIECDENGPIGPKNVTARSNLSFNWICKTCGTKWRSRICRRVKGQSNCPSCRKLSRNTR